MSKATVRGTRNPSAVWIVKRDGKRGGAYRIRWVDPLSGQTFSQSAGRDLALAREMRDAKKSELRDGLAGRQPIKDVSDLADVLPTFMAGKSAVTIRTTKRTLNEFIKLCGDRRLTRFDKSAMMQFRARRLVEGASFATVNKDLRQCKSALTHAVNAGWLRDNPLLKWKALFLTAPEKRIRVVEPAEFNAILGTCENPILRVLFIVAYDVGLRRTELANLRWTAVDLAKGVLHVENNPKAGEFTKSRKTRSLPMSSDVKANLAALLDGVAKIVEGGGQQPKYPHVFTWDNGQPFKPDWLTHEFARLAKLARVPHCTLHDLRRSWSTILQRAGVDRSLVKDLGGWSTLSVVERHYTGEVDERHREAMQAGEALRKGVG